MSVGIPLLAGTVALGALTGALWERAIPWLIARSDEDRSDQPTWTVRATSPPVRALASAAIAAAVTLRWGESRLLAPALVLALGLVGVTAIDLRFRIIPDRLNGILALAAIGFGVALQRGRLVEFALAGFLAALFLLITAVLQPGGIGMGDIKLVLVTGLFLGQAEMHAILAGFLLSLVPAVVLLVAKGRKSSFAFGPFLAAGALVALLTTAPSFSS